MRKSLLIMFLLFAAGIIANAQKFALIDMEYILKNIPAYQSASNELNQVSKQCKTKSRSWAKKPRACTTATRHPSKLFPMHKRQRKKKRLLPKRNPQPNCAVNTRSGRRTFQKA